MSANSVPAVLLLRRSSTAFWGELPRFLLLGALWGACLVLTATAVWTGAPQWIVSLSALPACLTMTAAAAAGAEVANGGRVRLLHLLRADPVLAGALWAVGVGGQSLLAAGGPAAALGCALAAAMALVLLPTLSYGAIAGLRGMAALRGGLLLVTLSPGMAMSLGALAVLAGFIVAASGGVLLLAAPGFLATLGAFFVQARLHELNPPASRRASND